MPLIFGRASLAFLLIFAASCSGEQPDGSAVELPARDPAISAAEKQAARALSLINSGTMGSVDAARKAELCSTAIKALNERIRRLGALSDEQFRALREAQGIYERRARTEGAGEQRPVEEARQLPGQQQVDGAQMAENARMAVACLRELQPA